MYSKYSKISNNLLFLFTNKWMGYQCGNSHCASQNTSREDPDQSDLGLHCLSRPVWQVAGVQYFRLSTVRERSGRVLDLRPKGSGFEPHRRHCVVVLEQATFILAKYWFNPGRLVTI